MPKEVHHKLSAIKVAKTTRPGRYADGHGLYLTVSETGGRSVAAYERAKGGQIKWWSVF